MNPPLSVLLFTVLSGAGLGMLALLVAVDFAGGASRPGGIPPAAMFVAACAGLVAVTAGLVASTGHLANPRNAWRAAARWRTSWLSREAVVAFALLAAGTLYAACWWTAAPAALRVAFALATLLLAWAMLVCTAMIYASLRPIRQWHTWRVPLGYVLLGHASGAVLLVALWRAWGIEVPALATAALVLLALAACAKLEYGRFVRGTAGMLTLEEAIGMPHGVVPPRASAGGASVMAARLLDLGHARDTFVTREFVHTLARRRRVLLVLAMWGFGFALPALWLAGGLARWQGAALAVLACFGGLLAERALFFADARHTVRLFHGEPRT